MATRPFLEDLLKDIPLEKLNQPCRDDHLSEIAHSLTDWQSIAPFLGLTEFEEREINVRYPNDLAMQNIAMLRKWKSKFAQNATYKTFVDVLWNCGKTSLAEQVCRMVSIRKHTSATATSIPDSLGENPRGKTGGDTSATATRNQRSALHTNYRRRNRGGGSATTAQNQRGAHYSFGNKPSGRTRRDISATTARNQSGALHSFHAGFRGRSRRDTSASSLNSYAEYLKGRYSTELPKFFTLQWPPPPTHKVFNLAMIGHETIQRGPIDDELVRLTLRGDVDDIIERKSSIELKNIFKLDSNRRKVILIEGAPGAGKSTLVWHTCQKWESGELFQDFKVVVFVQLRDPSVQSATSLADILPAKSEQMRTEIGSHLKSLNGQDVLFVLDGWDEYGTGLRAHSFFQQLICSPEEVSMHFSSLIITSRPIASGELQRYASSRVEIVGFTSAEVKKYFSEAVGDSETEQKLHDLLRERPVIEASCYLPLNAAIVVHLFLALSHTLPDTLHEVFLSLVICCIIRHLTRQAEEGKEIPDISSLDNLPPEVQEPFHNICAMAFHGVMKNKATFSAMDLRLFNLSTELNTLSLIQGIQSFTAFKASISCNFLHLSVQELLGAFHISKLPPAKQIKIFNDLFDQPRLAAVFRFYSAFTKLQIVGVRDIVARIVQKKQTPLLINLLHGLYEARDVSLCEFVASHLDGILNLRNSTLSPMDCLVVGYFLFCVCLTTSREFKVDLSGCSLDEYRVSFLVRELFKCSSSLKPLLTLDLSRNTRAVVHIAEMLRHTNFLKALTFPNCCIDDHGLKSLASAFESSGSLEELNLMGNHAVTGIGLMALGVSLKMNRGLKRLNLSHCRIGDQGLKSLASALEMNGSLEELDLRWNVAVTGIGLGESLKRNRGLKTLKFSCCGIDDQGMKSLASALEMNGSLEELDLRGNHAVTDIGLIAVGKSLKKNKGLKTLKIPSCNIGDQGVESLASALETNGSLEELGLSGNDAVTDIGLTALGESLKRNKGLKRLDLSNCGIGDQGMKSLASVLEMNGSLEELNLRSNDATTEIMALGESLKRNRQLKRLNLSYCHIDDQGMKSLAIVLEMNDSLEVLDLSGNDAVTGIGLMGVGESLKRNRGVKTLHLKLINISDNDWKQFILCLRENRHLTQLSFFLPTFKVVQQETEAINQIRRQKKLSLLVFV